MDDSLRRAAKEGNINDLYTLIQEDGNILKRVDKVEFINTPLHIAAEAGCIDFAMEIMSLKPSFARKLNHEGLSPIHIAVEKGHKELVLNLIQNANDLVRIKGKKGETPLHYVINREQNPELLPIFLEDCPDSIRDLTTANQTALHIAATSKNAKALKILCKMLRKTDYCEDVVNQKDRNGNTALHIAVRYNQHQMIELLLKCKADKHATNLAGSTPLDVVQQLNNRESIRILSGCFIPIVSTSVYKVRKQVVKHVTEASSAIFHDMDNISSDDRNALLVILVFLLTVTFQAGLSPAGGVRQIDSSSNTTVVSNVNLLDKNGPGRSVMGDTAFLLFYIPTCSVFIVTFFLTLGLLKPYPRGFRSALQLLLAFLAISFYASISVVEPTFITSTWIVLFSGILFILMMLMCISYRVSKISVSILGCCFFPMYPNQLVGLILMAVLGCLLFLFLYDEFLPGSILVVGFSLLIRFANGCSIKEIIILLGSWFFPGLCRFCKKRFNLCCNACTVQ